MSTRQFVFIGERPSPRARALRATWQSGRLAAKTLHRALKAAGIDPALQCYTNLLDNDGQVKRRVIGRLRRLVREDLIVVGLGRKVCRALTDQGIPHVALVHPAARGHIRRQDRYHRHVREALGVTRPLAEAMSPSRTDTIPTRRKTVTRKMSDFATELKDFGQGQDFILAGVWEALDHAPTFTLTDGSRLRPLTAQTLLRRSPPEDGDLFEIVCYTHVCHEPVASYEPESTWRPTES